jgi:hypothetical protein
MKKIIYIISIALASCSSYKEMLEPSEFPKWSIVGDSIYYNGNVVAYYDHCEYELNPLHGRHAKPIQELSIVQKTFLVKTRQLILYIHTIHPRQKVEIIVPNGQW